MRGIIKHFFILTFLFLFLTARAQTPISGIVNDYVKVTGVTYPGCSPCDNSDACLNGITVDDPSAFGAGDNALIIQMKGATIDVTNSATGGIITDIGNAGNYEFFTISKIVGNVLYPNGQLVNAYDPAGLIQVVRVPKYAGDVEVVGDITANPWNGTTGTGGVIAIFVEGTLELNADIDAGEIGYQGVTVSVNGSPNNCSVDPSTQMVKPSTANDVSPKGNGIVVDDPNTNGGRAPRANGGGSGVSGDSGGGGGSNFGAGGVGGMRWCDDIDAKELGGLDAGGKGGISLAPYLALKRVFMGGAGGAGFITNGNPAIATNGGGIVVIRADVIIGNGHTVFAQGANSVAPGTGIDGGGGGGGGGTVAFDIESYGGTVYIDVSGGDGQDLGTTTLHGPGGGGGGGAFLHNLSAPPANIIVDVSGGIAGVHQSPQNTNTNGAQDGSPGGIISYYAVNETEDFDNDNLTDFCDLDTDNDGIFDIDEDGGTGIDPSGDEDGDDIPNYRDNNDLTPGFPVFVDVNGDGVLDVYDNDLDGIPNFHDFDSDNDGIADVVEAGGTDPDGDGRVGIGPITDSDGDGLSDVVDPDNGGIALTMPDTDLDGIKDYLDLDSDNDGIVDVIEAGGTDPDGDGRIGTGIMPDSDVDGFADIVDTDNGGTNLSDPNSDGTGPVDRLDIDSDGDGIIDNIEGQGSSGYIAPSGVDTDRDGLDDAYDIDCAPCGLITGVAISPVYTDADGIPDYLDDNADGDSRSDAIEGWDTDGDGTADTTPSNTDSDGDGLDDAFDTVVKNALNPTTNATNGGTTPSDFPDLEFPGVYDRDWREVTPTIAFDLTSSDGDESISSANLEVILSAIVTADITVSYTITGTATGSGTDYTLASGSVTVTAGNLTNNIVIAGIIEDLLDESDETVIVTLVNPINAALGSNTVHTYTINDNDNSPVLSATDKTIIEGKTAVQIVTATDADSGDTQTFSVSGTDAGLFDIDPSSGVLTFKTAPNFAAPGDNNGDNDYELDVTVTDVGTNTDTKSITVSVIYNNHPVADDDSGATTEGGTVTIDLADGDSDVDGTLDLSSIIIGNETNGTVADNGDGTIDFTHDGSETLTGSFTYTIKDDLGAISNVTTVSIVISPINDSPVADDDTGATTEGGTVTINIADGDTDIDGTLDLSSIIIGNETNGTVADNGGGTVDFTHDGSETTTASFTYAIKDDLGAISNVATVSIVIAPINDSPVADDDSGATTEGGTVTIDLADGDSDVDGILDLSSIIIGNETNGTVADNGDGTIDFTHDGSETLTGSFTYTIKDDLGAISNVATVSIVISPINDAPVADDDSGIVDEGGTILIDLTDGDTDLDGILDLSSIIIGNETNGTVADNGDGTIDFTHDGSETLTGSFTYTIKDDLGTISNVATVSIVISPINDAPVADDDSGIVDEGGTVTIDLADGDTDVDGTLDLSSIIIGNETNGTVADNGDGTIDFTHDGSETLTGSFTYTIKDDLGAISNSAKVTITITPANSAPVAANDEDEMNQGNILAGVNLLANDTDPDGDILTISLIPISDVSNGLLTIRTNGTFRYTPDKDFFGADNFTYEVCDPNGNCATALVTITVNEVNFDLDNDGISNVDEGEGDTDGDGIPDKLDTDSDDDGISDREEGNIDTDGDGIPNYKDTDSDNDNYSDYEETKNGINADCDNDGTIDYLDRDKCDLIISKGFSPNSDGENDFWHLIGIERYPDNNVKIFNRWGNSVFEGSGYDNEEVKWIGQAEGALVLGNGDVPDGTYFYVINLGDGSNPLSGFLVVKH